MMATAARGSMRSVHGADACQPLASSENEAVEPLPETWRYFTWLGVKES